jgi:hypothetical protein
LSGEILGVDFVNPLGRRGNASFHGHVQLHQARGAPAEAEPEPRPRDGGLAHCISTVGANFFEREFLRRASQHHRCC